jgi:hypothetical protein
MNLFFKTHVFTQVCTLKWIIGTLPEVLAPFCFIGRIFCKNINSDRVIHKVMPSLVLSFPSLIEMSDGTVIELSVNSPSVHPVFGPASTLYPLFQWYLPSNEILLNLSTKCWNAALKAQGLRVIIVVVRVVAVKIYVAAVVALTKKEW